MQAATSSVVGLSAVLPAAVNAKMQARPRVAATPTRALTVRVRASAAVAVEAAEVDYSSNISVFPMEACDLIGGEACNVQMYPEAKLPSSSSATAAAARAEEVERDYLSYDEPRTVFPEEACDDLGGEFCEAPYQQAA
uniref:Light-regulated protein n=2 Tax=Oryza brachyantha TaxID=4533 RepID=J3KVL6_ORYBR